MTPQPIDSEVPKLFRNKNGRFSQKPTIFCVIARSAATRQSLSRRHGIPERDTGARNNKISKEPLNQSAAALSGSFAPTDRFENLEIRKGFLRFPNLNLETKSLADRSCDLIRASLKFQSVPQRHRHGASPEAPFHAGASPHFPCFSIFHLPKEQISLRSHTRAPPVHSSMPSIWIRSTPFSLNSSI